MEFDGIIFDLDGTLWDSTAEVAKTWSTIISEYNINRKEVTVEDLCNQDLYVNKIEDENNERML